MNKIVVVFLGFMLISPVAIGASGGTEPEFSFVKETYLKTHGKLEAGFGLLDKGFNGTRGTPVTNFIGAEYVVMSNFALSLGLPLAGTLSHADDTYGIGNVILGGKYLLPINEETRAVFGLDLFMPTASSDAVIGLFTRDLLWYFPDQTTVSPYVACSFTKDKLTVSVNVGGDISFFHENPDPSYSDVEGLVSYDIGIAYSFLSNLWVTGEFGGYSTVTYPEGTTQLFGGPGIRYQDRNKSAGLHFIIPVRSPVRDKIDFQAILEFRLFFY